MQRKQVKSAHKNQNTKLSCNLQIWNEHMLASDVSFFGNGKKVDLFLQGPFVTTKRRLWLHPRSHNLLQHHRLSLDQNTLNGFTNFQSRLVDYRHFGGIFAMTRSAVMTVSHPLEEWQYLPRRDWRGRSWSTFSLRCSWKAHKSHSYQKPQQGKVTVSKSCRHTVSNI